MNYGFSSERKYKNLCALVHSTVEDGEVGARGLTKTLAFKTDDTFFLLSGHKINYIYYMVLGISLSFYLVGSRSMDLY